MVCETASQRDVYTAFIQYFISKITDKIFRALSEEINKKEAFVKLLKLILIV